MSRLCATDSRLPTTSALPGLHVKRERNPSCYDGGERSSLTEELRGRSLSR
jgi:hypothetical protein